MIMSAHIASLSLSPSTAARPWSMLARFSRWLFPSEASGGVTPAQVAALLELAERYEARQPSYAADLYAAASTYRDASAQR